uniref:Putative secreted peptide n=1 Tax=Anopheles braziliensis TaxID=58242 RepID=A0A2M3ZVD8_9DIPT
MLLLPEPTGAVVLSVIVVPVALPAPPTPPPPAPPAAIPESLPDDELTLGSSGESGCPPVAFDGVAVLALLLDFDSRACCDDAVEDDEG